MSKMGRSFFDNVQLYGGLTRDVRSDDGMFIIKIYDNGEYYYLAEMTDDKVVISDSEPIIYKNYGDAESDLEKLKKWYSNISIAVYSDIYWLR